MLIDGTWTKLKALSTCQMFFFPKTISVILGRSHHADVCSSAHFPKSLVLISYLIALMMMACIPWSTAVYTCDWSGRCMGGDFRLQLQTLIIAVQTLAPNYVTRARLQQLYAGYFGFTFVQQEEAETWRSLCVLDTDWQTHTHSQVIQPIRYSTQTSIEELKKKAI